MVRIREAQLDTDGEEITELLREHLTPEANERRFDWLYRNSPSGPARAWIASNDSGNRAIGVAAAFPRHFRIDGSTRRVWVLGDFCFSKDHRSLGPAVMLQKACIDSVADEGWYDFPSQSMMAVYRRLRISPVGEFARYAKPIAINAKVEAFLPRNPLNPVIAAAGNTLLRLRSAAGARRATDLEFCTLDGELSDEFTQFDSESSVPGWFHGCRTSDFLNWRYRQHPTRRFTFTIARHAGHLEGYGVIDVEGPNATLIDIRAMNAEITVPAVVGQAEQVARGHNVSTLSAYVAPDTPAARYLQAAGFHRRESCPLVAQPGEKWMVFAGDRDS